MKKTLPLIFAFFCFFHAKPQTVLISENVDALATCNGSCSTVCTLANGWTNTTTDDIDWIVDNAGTSSSSTGPTVDHTTGSSIGKYIYTEASGCSNQQAIIISPTFNNTVYTETAVEFWYHMYGSSTGTLYIEASTNGISWTTLDSIIGQQQTSSGAAWLKKAVMLDGFSGIAIRVRFRGVTGTSYTSDMAIDDVEIIGDPLIYDFTQDTTQGCTPTTITFTNQTNDLAAYTYNWNFDDGTPTITDTLTTNINHTFAGKGTYNITMTVYNAAGAQIGSSSQTITINGLYSYDQFNVYSSTGSNEGCPGENLSFNAPWGYQTYIWDFADGTTDTTNNNWLNYTYSIPGTYAASVTILNVCGGNDTTLYSTIIINSTMPFPTWVYYSKWPNEACPDESVSFYTDWGYASYVWNFGDGNTSTTTDPNINHTYVDTGTYTTSVTLYNFCGNDTTLYDTVRVRYTPFDPWISIYVNNDYGMSSPFCPGEQVSFNGPWGYLDYEWNFGDGSPIISSPNPYTTHTYSSLGTYIASLKITQTCGNDTTITDTIIITNTVPFPTWINIYASPNPSCPFQDIYFSGPWGFQSYEWNWGDGTPSQTTSNSYKYHTYTSDGIYSVSLKITNYCGNDTTIIESVEIDGNLPFPSTYLNISNGNPSCPGNVSFYGGSGFQYYIWNFGDGSSQQTSTTNSTSHNYPNLGIYPISLKMIDYCGKDTTLYDTLTIQYQPFPAGMQFYVYDDNSCPGENINFSAPWGHVSYEWNFGDGNTLTGSNYVSHNYPAVGQYLVTVKITQLCGNDTTLTQTVKIINNQSFPSWVNLYHWPTQACPNESVNLDGPWGYAGYIWDFGDGNIDTNNTSSVPHTYTSAGTYATSVKVFNYCGLDTILNDTILIDGNMTISNPYLYSWIPNGGTNACPGEMINFDATWGLPSYEWNWGDGSPVDSGSFNFMNHAFANAGTYNISVKMTNYCENDTTVSLTVNVIDNNPIYVTPFINVSPMPTGPGAYCPGQQLGFSVQSGYPLYVWNYGDGSIPDSTSQNQVQKAYSTPGNYTVTVKVLNHCGNFASASATVTIDNDLDVNWAWINSYPNPACPNQDLVLSTDTNYVSYFWDFGDGFSAYGTSKVNHTYSSMGDYTVSVTLENHCGNDSTFSATITVDTTTSFPSWMGMWTNPWQTCPGEVMTFNTEAGFSSYFWDFGDGDTVTTSGSSIDHVYYVAGSYNASVTIENGCGNSTTLSQTITVSSSNWVYTPQIYTAFNSYCPGDEVMFLLNDWGSGAAGNYTYAWDFGDGTQDTTFGVGASHMYDSAGGYTATVIITNLCGNSATAIVPVKIVNNANPNLNSNLFGTLAQTNIVGCPGDAVVFYFVGTSYNLWDFGDGSTGIATEELVTEDGITITVIKHAYSTTGTYTVYLTLTNSCGNSATDSMTVQVMSNLLVDGGFIMEPPTGAGGYTTCRELSFIAYGGSSYEWNFGDGTTVTTISPTISHVYSQSGNYGLSVKITNGCGNSTTFSDAITITESGGPQVAFATGTDATCADGSDGTAGVSIIGGESPYTYEWSNPAETGQTTATASNLAAGTYDVTITDDIGCAIDTSVTIFEGAEIALSTSSTNTACGSSAGTASVSTSSGGTSPFTYLWSNGDTGSSASNLAAGSYTITVTDVNGCSASEIAAVSNTGGPTVAVDAVSNITCYGGDNGSISITATPQGGIFTYIWSNNNTTDDVFTLTAENYAVTVTDTAGCKTVQLVSVTEPDKLTLTFSTIGTECGEANGNATVSVSGGTPSYTYAWDSNAGSAVTTTVTGLSANAYTVTVTDGNGCSTTGTTTINNSNAPSLSYTETDVSCPGLSNGTIDLAVSKGTTPYSYIWTWSGGSSFVQDLNGLEAGTYTIMVQDASNCWIGTSITITEPSFSSSMNSSDATCGGNNDGSAMLTISGGASPYNYLWSNAATTGSISNLTAGTYTVQITDTNNCTINDTAVISEPAVLVVLLSANDVSCYGGNDGDASATVSGATEPYTYAWSNGSTNSTINVLNANTYIVTVTDSCGTSTVDSITVSQPAQFTTSMSSTNISCYSGGDGTATVTASGGTSPYNYSWNNGQTTSTAYGLFPGTQSVNAFDANGCLASNFVTITQPNALSATIAGSYVSCNSGGDGAADLTVSGGTAPFTYSWSTGESMEDISALAAGTYSVTISDSCGATVSENIAITEPGALSTSIAATDVNCNGNNTGSADLAVSGGVAPYVYSWSDGSTTEDISALIAANYAVTVTDNCGISASNSVTISEPAALTTTISGTNVSCYGFGDGDATITPNGGTTPYSYQWNNNQTNATAIGLFLGNYSVNVFDDNGCLASNNITISQPSAISLTVSSTAATCGYDDGTATAAVSGGTPGYSYSWSTGSGFSSLDSLAQGTYAVTVTDINGCTSIGSAAIGSITNSHQICLITVDSTSTKNVIVWEKPNATNIDYFTVYRDIAGTYTAIGTVPYDSLSKFTDNTSGVNPNTTSYRYKLTVTDTCSSESALSDYHETIHLTNSIGLNNEVNLVWDNYEGFAFSYYRILRDSGGTGNWQVIDSITSNNFTFSDQNPPTGGVNYAIEIVSPLTCSATKAAENFNSSRSNISQMTGSTTPLSATSSATDAIAGNCDGTANVTASGGMSPYTYQWDGNAGSQTDATAIGLCAGTYSVTVTDANGASTSVFATVGTSGGSNITATTSTTSATFGICDGTATVTASGGTSPYSYQWDGNAGSQTDQMATGLCPNVYFVTVTDAGGSTTTTAATVGEMVGIADNQFTIYDLQIVPNPNKGVFTVKTKSGKWLADDVELRILNVMGETVYLSTVSHQLSAVNIDLSQKSSGIYYLQVITAKEIAVKKVVIE